MTPTLFTEKKRERDFPGRGAYLISGLTRRGRIKKGGLLAMAAYFKSHIKEININFLNFAVYIRPSCNVILSPGSYPNSTTVLELSI